MPKLVYITCLPHSGSTLLNLLLGQHPGLIGVGGIEQEISWIVRAPEEAAQQICSCSETVENCVYWKQVMVAARQKPVGSLLERYDLALTVFERVFGPDIWPVDASQIREPILELATQKNLDLRALFLAKDFRSAIVSMIDLRRLKRRARRPVFMLAMEAALRWWRENARIARSLRSSGVKYLPVGYEELCLSLDSTFSRISAFLDLPPAPPTTDVRAGHNHSFVGNRMRKQESKARVAYDYRWMTRTDWQWPAVLLPGLTRRNREWVYANGGDQIFRIGDEGTRGNSTGASAQID